MISTESDQHIPPDYEDLIASFMAKLLVALAQHLTKSTNFLTVCYKPVWLMKVLSVVVSSDSFHGFLMWLSQVDIYWKLRVFLCKKHPIFIIDSSLFFIILKIKKKIDDLKALVTGILDILIIIKKQKITYKITLVDEDKAVISDDQLISEELNQFFNNASNLWIYGKSHTW